MVKSSEVGMDLNTFISMDLNEKQPPPQFVPKFSHS